MAVKTEKNTDANVAVFEKPDLIEAAHVFNTTPELMAGALSKVRKNKITKAEAQEALDTFLCTPVQ